MSEKVVRRIMAGGPACLPPGKAQVQLLQRRDIGCPGEPGQARLPRRCVQRALAHRHNGVLHTRRQGLPGHHRRLLRRKGGGEHHVDLAERGTGEYYARRCRRHAGGRRAPHRSQRRGCRCRWPGWIERCERYGTTRSMSRRGCSPDNSAMEGFFGRLKVEFFYGRDRKGWSIGRSMGALGEYIDWYNEKRIMISLGGLSPAQYRRSLGLAA